MYRRKNTDASLFGGGHPTPVPTTDPPLHLQHNPHQNPHIRAGACQLHHLPVGRLALSPPIRFK